MGDFEAPTLVGVELSVKYHPYCYLVLYDDRYPVIGPCMVGSLTGAVASQRVAEAFKGWLASDGNRSDSVYA